MFHILWCFQHICSFSSLKLPSNYLYSDLVNPLWDGLLEHEINFKPSNSITLQSLFNLKSTVMGHVVICSLNKYSIFNWKNINIWFVNKKIEITSFWKFWDYGLTQSLLIALRLTLACSHPSIVAPNVAFLGPVSRCHHMMWCNMMDIDMKSMSTNYKEFIGKFIEILNSDATYTNSQSCF